jgi:hypothetical protein
LLGFWELLLEGCSWPRGDLIMYVTHKENTS